MSLSDVRQVLHPARGAQGGAKLDDEKFVAAADLVELLHREHSFRRVIGFVITHPADCLRAALLILGLPRLRVPVTDSMQGRIIAARLRSHEGGLRTHALAQGVLDVPAELTEYLKGRNRQGLRNKLSKAQRGGINTSLESTEGGGIADKVIFNQRIASGDVPVATDSWPLPPEALTWFVAYGPGDRPIATCAVVMDRDVAVLKLLHARTDTPLSSPARHALHQCLLAHLSETGVRYLVGDSALRVAPGVREFMHQLGYRAWHLRPFHPDGSGPKPRLSEPEALGWSRNPAAPMIAGPRSTGSGPILG